MQNSFVENSAYAEELVPVLGPKVVQDGSLQQHFGAKGVGTIKNRMALRKVRTTRGSGGAFAITQIQQKLLIFELDQVRGLLMSFCYKILQHYLNIKEKMQSYQLTSTYFAIGTSLENENLVREIYKNLSQLPAKVIRSQMQPRNLFHSQSQKSLKGIGKATQKQYISYRCQQTNNRKSVFTLCCAQRILARLMHSEISISLESSLLCVPVSRKLL